LRTLKKHVKDVPEVEELFQSEEIEKNYFNYGIRYIISNLKFRLFLIS